MTRHGFAHRLALHAASACQTMSSRAGKRFFPHLLRHSCAAHTLELTGDIRRVSPCLGHARIQSTEIHLRSDAIGKLGVLAARLSPAIRTGSFKAAPDRLLAKLRDARRLEATFYPDFVPPGGRRTVPGAHRSRPRSRARPDVIRAYRVPD